MRKTSIEELAERFEILVESRQMDQAEILYRENEQTIRSEAPSSPCAVRLVDCATRLLDRHGEHLLNVEHMLKRFTPEIRSSLSIRETTRLVLSDGVMKLHQGLIEVALRSLELALGMSKDNGLTDIAPTVSYYMARCHARLGNPDLAIELAQSALASATHPRMRAQIEMTLAWNRFVRGDEISSVQKILADAEEHFGPDLRAEDCVEYCNILSFKGRMARQLGLYREALELFEQAAEILLVQERDHPVHGRVLTHLATTKLLRARQIENQPGKVASERKQVEAESRALRLSALNDLRQAEQVYSKLNKPRGLANVQNHRAWVCLETREFDRARHEARAALNQFNNHDPVARAHCLIISAYIELEDENGNLIHARRCAEDALTLTDKMARRRVRARARIALALTLLSKLYADQRTARRLMTEARNLVGLSDGDYLKDEMEDLEERMAAPLQQHRILEVTMEEVLKDGLRETLKRVERTIVESVYRADDKGNRQVARTAKVLRASRNHIKLVLESERQGNSSPLVPNPLVNSVTV